MSSNTFSSPTKYFSSLTKIHLPSGQSVEVGAVRWCGLWVQFVGAVRRCRLWLELKGGVYGLKFQLDNACLFV